MRKLELYAKIAKLAGIIQGGLIMLKLVGILSLSWWIIFVPVMIPVFLVICYYIWHWL